ncbi:cytochrome bd oxidase small subunit CydS [Paenibacillus endoradicis]
MNFHDFTIFVLPLVVVVLAVIFLFVWGALGNTKEK